MKNYQSASAVLMVRPSSFGFDEQTAETNAFQHHSRLKDSSVTKKAIDEFEGAIRVLRQAGIEVVVFEDKALPLKPNGVFVNNWLTTWPDGTIYLYPMATKSRRHERNPKVLDELKKSFVVGSVVDFSPLEHKQKFLEGTGVLVFDHVNKIAYASLSKRCDEELLLGHIFDLGYRPIIFQAFDKHGAPIYHTNVVLGVQSSTAVVCSEVITDRAECQTVLEALYSTGHTVIDVTQKQMEKFCGNVLEVRSRNGKRFLVLSQTALDNLTPEQQQQLNADKSLVPLHIPTIEAVGGVALGV